MVVVGDLLQPTHLLFVLVVALLVLGPKRLPEVGRSLGRGLRDFRAAMSGMETSEMITPMNTAPASPETASPETASTEPTPPPGEPVGAASSAPSADSAAAAGSATPPTPDPAP